MLAPEGRALALILPRAVVVEARAVVASRWARAVVAEARAVVVAAWARAPFTAEPGAIVSLRGTPERARLRAQFGAPARAQDDDVLLARAIPEGLLRAVEEERALLGGDRRDLHARELGRLVEHLVGAQRLSVDHRVGDDEHGAAVAGEHAARLEQHRPQLSLPTLDGFVRAEPTVSAPRADLAFGEAALLEPQPAQPVQVVIEVVVDPRVRR